MTSKDEKRNESDLERRLREAGLDQEEIDEDALRAFLDKKPQKDTPGKPRGGSRSSILKN